MSQNPTPVTAYLPGQVAPEQYIEHFEQKCSFFEHQLQLFCDKSSAKINKKRFASASQGYRLRAEFRIWHQDNQIHYAMMKPGKDKTPRMIDVYLPGSWLIQTTMPLLLSQLVINEGLKKQLFQVEFLSSI